MTAPDEGPRRPEPVPYLSPPVAVAALGLLAAAYGTIYVFAGAATLFSSLTLTSGPATSAHVGAVSVIAVATALLGAGLCVGAWMLWRALPGTRRVLGFCLGLHAVCSIARVALDQATFTSLLGCGLSLSMVLAMAVLLCTPSVSAHLDRGPHPATGW